MVHIKNDKRAEKSVELICDALLNCLREKEYSKISISDIQRASTVSRSTFYRNFDSMDDVLALLCDSGFREIFQGCSSGRPGALNLAVFHYWYEHSALLEAVVRSGRTAIFTDSLRRGTAERESASSLFPDEARFDYFISTVSHVIFGILTAWIRRGKTESEAELTAILKDCFSAAAALGLMA